MLTREDMSLTQIKEKVARINAYMRHRDLPLAIKLQIRSHFSYLWQRTSVWDEDEILLELPSFLRTEVTLHNNRAIIQSVAFLDNLDAQCLAKVCLKLVLTRVAPGAIVVREGEVGNDLYFIANGSIALLITLPPGVAADLDVEPRAGFATLRRGDSFAHYSIAATKTAKHPYSARSLDSSELLVLSAPNFRALRDEFPNFGVAMGRLVAARRAAFYGRLTSTRHLTAVRHAVVRYGLADDGEPRSCYRSCGRSLRGGRPRDRGSLAGGAAGGAYDAFGPSEHDASVLDDFEEQRSVRAHRHDPPAPRSKLPDGLTARVALAACLWLKRAQHTLAFRADDDLARLEPPPDGRHESLSDAPRRPESLSDAPRRRDSDPDAAVARGDGERPADGGGDDGGADVLDGAAALRAPATSDARPPPAPPRVDAPALRAVHRRVDALEARILDRFDEMENAMKAGLMKTLRKFSLEEKNRDFAKGVAKLQRSV